MNYFVDIKTLIDREKPTVAKKLSDLAKEGSVTSLLENEESKRVVSRSKKKILRTEKIDETELDTAFSLDEASGFGELQVFNAESDINPLTAAAAPLFALALRLKVVSKNNLDAGVLFDYLNDEVTTFAAKLEKAHYSHNMITMAHYVICAFFDEIVQGNLVKDFHDDDNASERVFALIEYARKNHQTHLDFLVLAYLCLRLGFMGKYRNVEGGADTVKNISDSLYHFLHEERGEKSRKLLVE
ncbi:MAG: type IVB secretion system protein IcmH/DotU [Gammaproteobacteria bacterium]